MDGDLERLLRLDVLGVVGLSLAVVVTRGVVTTWIMESSSLGLSGVICDENDDKDRSSSLSAFFRSFTVFDLSSSSTPSLENASALPPFPCADFSVSFLSLPVCSSFSSSFDICHICCSLVILAIVASNSGLVIRLLTVDENLSLLEVAAAEATAVEAANEAEAFACDCECV